MTLEEALRKHLGCTHEPFHPEALMYAQAIIDTRRWSAFPDDDVAFGSVLFHGVAIRLLDIEGHVRTPMHITDEEYAGFVA